MTWHSLNDCIPIPYPFQSFIWDGEVLLALLQRGHWKNKCLVQHHTGRQSRKLKPFCLSPRLWSSCPFTALFASETRLLLLLHFLLPCCYRSLSWKATFHYFSFGHPHHVARVANSGAQGDPAKKELSPVISWDMPATCNVIGSQATASELTLIQREMKCQGRARGKVRRFVINHIASLTAYNWKWR